MPIFSENFSASCIDGTAKGIHCTVSGGIIQSPKWYTDRSFEGSIWRIGDALTLNFRISEPTPNSITLNVFDTGSWGSGEYTLAKITVNGKVIVDSYVPPDCLENGTYFAIPKTYLQKGNNTIVFSLSSGNFVWWIRKIESRW
jgi:hypothetical protein